MELIEQIQDILQPHEQGLSLDEIRQILEQTGYHYQAPELEIILNEMISKEMIEKTIKNDHKQYRKNEHIVKEAIFRLQDNEFLLIFIQNRGKRVVSLLKKNLDSRAIVPMSHYSQEGITPVMMNLIYDWEDEVIDIEEFLVAWEHEHLPPLKNI